MRRGRVAGILLEYGEAKTRFQQIRLYCERLVIVTAGRIKVSFDQIGRADSSISKARLRDRCRFLPPVARPVWFAEMKTQIRDLFDDLPGGMLRLIRLFE